MVEGPWLFQSPPQAFKKEIRSRSNVIVDSCSYCSHHQPCSAPKFNLMRPSQATTGHDAPTATLDQASRSLPVLPKFFHIFLSAATRHYINTFPAEQASGGHPQMSWTVFTCRLGSRHNLHLTCFTVIPWGLEINMSEWQRTINLGGERRPKKKTKLFNLYPDWDLVISS
jgi:hypothetical protein